MSKLAVTETPKGIESEPSEALTNAIYAHWAGGTIAAHVGNYVSDLVVRLQTHTLREAHGFLNTKGGHIIDSIRMLHPHCELRGSDHCQVIQEFVNFVDLRKNEYGA